MTIAELHHLFLDYPTVCTDSRSIPAQSIFFALKGTHFNGNAFAAEALNKGAAYAVVDEKQYATSTHIIVVDDVLETLQNLARYHRNYCTATIIALTGSNGKTTTKELIYNVLSKKYKTIATKGNLNNHIGVPLTLLSIEADTEIAIVEMGANHQKEIAFLCSIATPDFGYITNFGKAHLEGFGGEEGVIKGKSELYDYLISHNKRVCINADDPIQQLKWRQHQPTFGFSESDNKFYHIQFLEANPFVHLSGANTLIETQLIGSYNFHNCAAAVAFGLYLKVPLIAIKAAIEAYIPKNNRSQLLQKNGHHIILDAYNANPSSMKAALDNFKMLSGERKVLFLGDMFELGAAAEEEHQRIVDHVSELGFEKVILVGENFYRTTCSFPKFRTYSDLEVNIANLGLHKNQILIKGSRGMALERILEAL
ncbi:UDP-N-acetylmuramoyl-tripeptide--D-alanyl-D-alanine ligase [Arenibacter sp. GZD96]|uniref:UDP-N-acetylmuramoyl-tripeptide--D-alanyl-D- alanine ligase n=1 Tax=Aurantibrevibacter litoralis TaxID=3106030 RepID=UPI002AFFDF20|nr:UDP-N-acetylmuramoyl-tripeptide--D-alanyl-D-alanine ligase [Arenibacter sp. GZD-96]MEA1785945.1 UDP-N-acetylmuramoyl-tripeptide--D-alanyl-D-alanine ligase [Arenibacter sp. GZD-96]